MLIKHRYLGTGKSATGISHTPSDIYDSVLSRPVHDRSLQSRPRLHLTDRQLVVGGTIDVASAQKTSAKLLSMDAGAGSHLPYGFFDRGTAQGVMLLADTVRALKARLSLLFKPKYGAGSALAVLTDACIRPADWFSRNSIRRREKAQTPKADEKEKPKELTEKAKAASVGSAAYLKHSESYCESIENEGSRVREKMEAGGFHWTARQTLVAHSVVEKLMYTKLHEGKTEVKTTTTVKTDRTVAPTQD